MFLPPKMSRVFSNRGELQFFYGCTTLPFKLKKPLITAIVYYAGKDQI